MEVYRSRDGRWSIERAVDRYLVYDEHGEEVWSCRTVAELYDWLDERHEALCYRGG